MSGALIRLLQGLLLLPTSALFIGLLTDRLQQGGLGLAWPLPTEPDAHVATELALACLPAFVLFLLGTSAGVLRKGAILPLFCLCVAVAAYCAVNLLASAYGNTWTAGEIFRELYLGQLTLLGLAALPALLLMGLLEHHNRLCQ